MLTLFDKNFVIPIVLAEDAAESVKLAASDLVNDISKVSACAAAPCIAAYAQAAAITIINKGGDRKAADAESYTVSVTDQGVVITGADDLGTIYGIYAFSEKILGIDPMYYYTDLLPDPVEKFTIEAQTIVSGNRKVRYRGWFLNDEDLLVEFPPIGGHREIDYPFYQTVTGQPILGHILEAMLRLELNLIIPASFVNILNPDEEALIKAAVRRGLYVTQHHVEPMGVSYFGADQYIVAHGGEPGTVSFVKDPETMEKIWRLYAERWGKYGEQVIWQLGLRGKADRAVWTTDPNVPNSNEKRGKIISDAIALQHRIVCETLGRNDFPSTSTLWMEGAELYAEGHLKFPEGVTIILSDISFNLMWADDMYTLEKRPGHQYGVYYHINFWGNGPHFAEGTHPAKMQYCYRDALANNCLYYSILNVSNVRETHTFSHLNAELLKDPDHFDASAWLEKYDQTVFGSTGKAVTDLRMRYYDSFIDLGNELLHEECDRSLFHYHDYGKPGFINYSANDGKIKWLGYHILDGDEKAAVWISDRAKASMESFLSVLTDMQSLETELPEKSRGYFRLYVEWQCRYLTLLTTWLYHITADDRTAAAKALQTMLEERVIEEQGKWENWYTGDKKMNIRAMLEKTLA